MTNVGDRVAETLANMTVSGRTVSMGRHDSSHMQRSNQTCALDMPQN